MFKAFVSYSTHDLKNVAKLQQSLAGAGVEVLSQSTPFCLASLCPKKSLRQSLPVTCSFYCGV